MTRARVSHSSHWGAFAAEVRDGEVVRVHPHHLDEDPSPLLGNIPGSLRHPARITQPMVRAGWLERGPGPDPARGAEPFVPMSWHAVTALLATELRRVTESAGPGAVYGGSYGWASAGRFHHAQSQVHRFLNCLGGYTSSVNTYSLGASAVILPHVVGTTASPTQQATSWRTVAEHAELMVCFGGISLKNVAVSPGGASVHMARRQLHRAAERGVEFASFSPIRDDLPEVALDWYPIVPGTDVAVMLAMAYVLVDNGLHDIEFLTTYCEGFERFERYLRGLDDGQPKTPEWAESISRVAAADIERVARRMARRRTMVTVAWSLQRADHGEQAPWMGITLAALLGYIGMPGGGFGHGYGSMAQVGTPSVLGGLPTLPQGRNPVSSFIPVARISDMLLNPGQRYDYNGRRFTYPDIKLVYWCGGNPFHHHQDLSRLRRAFSTPDTLVVHEPYWTATARHADIVLPTTVSLERDDIGGSRNDPRLIAMKQATEPYAQARNDYQMFADLAGELGVREAFTENRNEGEWLRHLYDVWRARVAADIGFQPPGFDTFWDRGEVDLPTTGDAVLFADFRTDPVAHRLSTPSGRIEIFSATVDEFGYPDCPGHPTWLEPAEWLGSSRTARFPLHLIANQPATRLHSQLDLGGHSQASKISGREPIRMHPADAVARGLAPGEIVRVFNDRGSCLAGLVVSDLVSHGVVQMSTGAWYDPLDPADLDSMCVHGNPNTLTLDKGTSRLAQGSTGAHALVEVERYPASPPDVTAFQPPKRTELWG